MEYFSGMENSSVDWTDITSNIYEGSAKTGWYNIQASDWPTSNPKTFHHLDIVEDIFYIIVTPSLCIFGCIGNVMNLVVLTKIRLRMRKVDGSKEGVTHLGLMLLAISDLFFCISTCPQGFGRLASTSSLFSTRGFGLYYQVYGTGFVTSFILTSTWITVAMAVLRYIGICHPLATRRMDSRVYGRMAYATVIILSILVNLPAFWQYKIEMLVMEDGQTSFLVDIGLFDPQRLYGRVFLWVRAFYAIFVPAILLAYCNASLILTLRQSYRMRRAYRVQDSASKNSSRITLLLVVLVVMFVLLVFPSELMDFCTDNIKLDVARTETFLAVRAFANFLQVLNFAVNFVLYCIMNVHFRSTMHDLFCCFCHRAGRDRKHRGFVSRSNSNVGQTTLTNIRLVDKMTPTTVDGVL